MMITIPHIALPIALAAGWYFRRQLGIVAIVVLDVLASVPWWIFFIT